ncbi:MAG: hypothetical protein AAGA66_12745 [Bacteroidota bacterium]
MDATIKKVVALSRKNPTEIYRSDEGKIVFSGQVFDNEEDMKSFVKNMDKYSKPITFFSKILSFFKGKR